MLIEYSNPRTEATFTNWPYGKFNATAIFKVEVKRGKGERVTRVTVDPRSGRHNAPKTTTYARIARIMDGSDGRTYAVQLSSLFELIIVMESNLQLQYESVGASEARFPALRALLLESQM